MAYPDDYESVAQLSIFKAAQYAVSQASIPNYGIYFQTKYHASGNDLSGRADSLYMERQYSLHPIYSGMHQLYAKEFIPKKEKFIDAGFKYKDLSVKVIDIMAKRLPLEDVNPNKNPYELIPSKVPGLDMLVYKN